MDECLGIELRKVVIALVKGYNDNPGGAVTWIKAPFEPHPGICVKTEKKYGKPQTR